MIKKKLSSDADDDLCLTSIRVTLVCPLGQCRVSSAQLDEVSHGLTAACIGCGYIGDEAIDSNFCDSGSNSMSSRGLFAHKLLRCFLLPYDEREEANLDLCRV